MKALIQDLCALGAIISLITVSYIWADVWMDMLTAWRVSL